ncbi:MAG: hypothetical protein IPL40_12095 [Proteobacteria bacterium]|nr:hypothetical protein [Pseudomonadota bacterium]
MAPKTPLQRVKEEHGGKEKLADRLLELIERGDEDKAELRKRLLAAANSKLLRLHQVVSEVQQRFGSKEKLLDALLDAMKRSKDQDYRAKLRGMTPARLLDLYRAQQRRNKAAQAAAGS